MGTDNTRYLVEAAAARHLSTMRRARQTIERLDRRGESITFAAVATAAGVSRAWLYREPEVRASIIRLRSTRQTTAASAPSAQRATLDSVRQRLDATREEIARLRAENALLRDQLARNLGERRAER